MLNVSSKIQRVLLGKMGFIGRRGAKPLLNTGYHFIDNVLFNNQLSRFFDNNLGGGDDFVALWATAIITRQSLRIWTEFYNQGT